MNWSFLNWLFIKFFFSFSEWPINIEPSKFKLHLISVVKMLLLSSYTGAVKKSTVLLLLPFNANKLRQDIMFTQRLISKLCLFFASRKSIILFSRLFYIVLSRWVEKMESHKYCWHSFYDWLNCVWFVPVSDAVENDLFIHIKSIIEIKFICIEIQWTFWVMFLCCVSIDEHLLQIP